MDVPICERFTDVDEVDLGFLSAPVQTLNEQLRAEAAEALLHVLWCSVSHLWVEEDEGRKLTLPCFTQPLESLLSRPIVQRHLENPLFHVGEACFFVPPVCAPSASVLS